MTIPFLKAHGTGNDFVLVRHSDVTGLDRAELARTLCTRHLGIGSDGLIVIEPHASLDYRMDFYNPDGSQSFCGNGSRCAYRAATKWGYASGRASFEAIDGTHQAWEEEGVVCVSMQDTPSPELGDHDFVFTGSPHAVVWVDDPHLRLDLREVAEPIRHSDKYAPGGTNVNVAALAKSGNGSSDFVAMRTFERGVEDETLSCGTGVTATALVAATRFGLPSPVGIVAPGGELAVCFERSEAGFTEVVLQGEVTEVFTGTIDL